MKTWFSIQTIERRLRAELIQSRYHWFLFRYEMFHLLNQEFAFDVDVSNLPCGLNGALYFVAMDPDGGQVEIKELRLQLA